MAEALMYDNSSNLEGHVRVQFAVLCLEVPH